MKRARSISYAPETRSLGDSPMSSAAVGAWTLCRKFDAFPVRDGAMLQSWTEQGRVRPDDYLVSLELDLCVQARDVAELAAIFQKTRARLLGKVWRSIACAALGFACVQPLFGAALLISAILASTVCSRTARRAQTYSLSSTDSNSLERRSADCSLALARPA